MKKTIIWIIVAILLIGGGITLYVLFFPVHTSQVCYQQYCFAVEIADSDAERQKGLMFRESLPENEGMLFLYTEPGLYSFWMKNTLIPLDMVWIAENGEVVDIQTALPCTQDPCPSYRPAGIASYILELNAETSKKIGLTSGEKLQISL